MGYVTFNTRSKVCLGAKITQNRALVTVGKLLAYPARSTNTFILLTLIPNMYDLYCVTEECW